ncbi:MAG: AraC family transcriptional regulator [Lachnospiraceae bacterium]|nr:AraC family transcriptional regulator [Lachnospiraceae bacterium]
MHEKENLCMYPVAPPFDIAYKKAAASFPVGPHSHNAAELYLTLTELPDVLLNDTVSAVPAGSLLVIPSFCVHQLYHETGVIYERYILSIHTDWLDKALCDAAPDYRFLSESHRPLLIKPDKGSFEELLSHLKKLLSLGGDSGPEALAAFFSFLRFLKAQTDRILLASSPSLPISPSQERVNEMIAYIRDHIGEDFGLDDLASRFYLHPDYLARLFKKHMHIPIGRYITLQKISKAEELLRSGQSVRQVQEALGYSSYAYFFKSFQKYTGISPSRYRMK